MPQFRKRPNEIHKPDDLNDDFYPGEQVAVGSGPDGELVARRAHLEHGEGCWCSPKVVQPCPECDEPPNPTCWRCQGEGVVEPYDEDVTRIIIHNDSDEKGDEDA